MRHTCDLIRELFLRPEGARRLSHAHWDELVRIASAAGLLARLAGRLREGQAWSAVPSPVRWHLEAAERTADAHHRSVRWEIRRIAEALGSVDLPFALLKGAAYVAAGLPAARGRVFEDVDILVPRARLEEAEAALGVHGWVTTHRHPYDQRYYRRWMHEIPPMEHIHRGTTIDVHHALIPVTARLKPDSERLWAAAEPVAGWAGMRILGPEDMVLHACAHLFFDGALENGLRDLMDLDALLRHFGQRPEFWVGLRRRGEALDLLPPLADALRWSRRLLATPVPAEAVPAPAATGRSRMRLRALDALYGQGLRPEHPACGGAINASARGILYLRSHLLRMPPRLLVPHLVRKALRPAEAAG
jgi:hypothetical protein